MSAHPSFDRVDLQRNEKISITVDFTRREAVELDLWIAQHTTPISGRAEAVRELTVRALAAGLR